MSDWGQYVFFNTPPAENHPYGDMVCAESLPQCSTYYTSCCLPIGWSELLKDQKQLSNPHIANNILTEDKIEHDKELASSLDGCNNIGASSSDSLSEVFALSSYALRTKGVTVLPEYRIERSLYNTSSVSSCCDSFDKKVHKKGILVKRGFFWRKAWFERLVVLRETTLEYYESDDEQQPIRGKLELEANTICRPSRCDWRRNCFEIISGSNDIWYLQAPSQNALSSWMSTINAIIQNLREEITSVKTDLTSSIHKKEESDEVAVDLFTGNRGKKVNRSPPVTPPMQIYYSSTSNNGDQQRMKLPPSPRLHLCVDKRVNIIWPAPNYKFADTDKVDSRKDSHSVHI